MDKLLILTFWEIIKSKNYSLLDIDYSEDKTYSESETAQFNLLWSKLEDEYYTLKKDSKSYSTIVKSNDAFNLLMKIELLQDNLNSLVELYSNIEVLDQENFIRIEQKIYQNFTLIHDKITPQYFAGLEENFNLITRFINAFKSDYEINYKIVTDEIHEEVTNVYSVVASVSSVLRYQINIKEVNVMEWLGYEEVAKQKINSQKEANNGK